MKPDTIICIFFRKRTLTEVSSLLPLPLVSLFHDSHPVHPHGSSWLLPNTTSTRPPLHPHRMPPPLAAPSSHHEHSGSRNPHCSAASPLLPQPQSTQHIEAGVLSCFLFKMFWVIILDVKESCKDSTESSRILLTHLYQC